MADEDNNIIETASSSLEDIKDNENLQVEDRGVAAIVRYVSDSFEKAKDYRESDEIRWLRAYRNYRGLYGQDVQFTETEKSRVFIKITKTKTLAAYGQVADVLFAGQKFPLSIEPTTLPEGVTENVTFDPNEPEQLKDDTSPYGFSEDGREFPAGATLNTLNLGPLEQKLENIKVKEGVGGTPTAATLSPSLVAAKKMEKQIMDQLEESNASKHLRNTAFEMALFGTGVIKGPFANNKEYPSWDNDGEYNPSIKTVPSIEHVSIWNFYPDPDANNMDEAQYIIERHKLSRSQLRQLKKRPFFRGNVIDECIKLGEMYRKESWEDDLADYEIQQKVNRFEVIEYWGIVDKDLLDDDIDIPKELEDADQLQANVWICGDKVLRLVLNPFKPVRIPYMAVPYELNPYSFFGVGIAENMDDTQTLMNGFMRMAVDNAVLSGNLVIEVDETNLVPGQDLSVYPGKVFRRQGGAPGQAIFGTKFPNISNENMQFNFNPEIMGDLEVKARGTESLMANEVRSQRLMQFLGVASSPNLAPFAKFHYIIGEIAKSMGLDPEKVTNSMEDAAIQAELLKQFQQDQPTPDAPAGINPQDPTGAGGATIGTGQAPVPGEQGFSGNDQPTQPTRASQQDQTIAQQPPTMDTLQ